MTPEHAALIDGEPLPRDRVDSFLETRPFRGAGNGAISHDAPAPAGRQPEAPSVARQRRRWATQVVVTDELARRACTDRGLKVPEEVSPASVLAVAETDVADLGSIVAAALAHSPAARALLAALEAEQTVPETAVRDYYDRNQDRFLTPAALRRGVTPSTGRPRKICCRTTRSARASRASSAGQPAARRSSVGWTRRAAE